MTDAILAAKPDALFIGISTDRFWSMTYMEIVDEIEAYNRRKESDSKDYLTLNASLDYALGRLIGWAFNDPKNYPATLEAAYPGLFEKRRQQNTFDWQDHKAQFKAYAAEFNKQRGGG